jgi:hypothetical protein
VVSAIESFARPVSGVRRCGKIGAHPLTCPLSRRLAAKSPVGPDREAVV